MARDFTKCDNAIEVELGPIPPGFTYSFTWVPPEGIYMAEYCKMFADICSRFRPAHSEEGVGHRYN